MHKKFLAVLMLAAIAVFPACRTVDAPLVGATCEQMGEYAADMLDDSVTAEDIAIKYDVLPFEVTNDLAEMNDLLYQVYTTVPKNEHIKVPNAIVHLCYAKGGCVI